VKGFNLNGTASVEAPLMLLAHEIVHAGHAADPGWQTPSAETTVIAVANQIATEINAATGSHFDTTRDNEIRSELWDTDKSTSTVPSIVRP
jgi:hypothetical protein